MNTPSTVVAISAMGILGAISMAPVIPGLIRRVMPADKPMRISMPAIVALALLQTSLLVVLSAWIGARLGTALQLRSALFDAVAGGRPIGSAFAGLAVPGIILGAVGGLAAFSLSKTFVSFLRAMPLATRLLYGGLTEEVIMRWGLMTAIVWLLSRGIVGASTDRMGAVVFAGILATNAIFAAAHIPVLRATNTSRPREVALIIFLVSIPWGWLFWQYGIESAMIAHMTFHAAIEVLGKTRTGGGEREESR